MQVMKVKSLILIILGLIFIISGAFLMSLDKTNENDIEEPEFVLQASIEKFISP